MLLIINWRVAPPEFGGNHMKKLFVTLFVFFAFVTLTGCGEITSDTTSIYAEVVECEEHFYPNYAYEQLARKHSDSYALHHQYLNLAVENGHYEYSIAILIDGQKYTVTRKEKANVGDVIEVTKIATYYGGEIIDVEYK